MFFQENILSLRDTSISILAGTSYRQVSKKDFYRSIVKMLGSQTWIFPKQVHGDSVLKVLSSKEPTFQNQSFQAQSVNTVYLEANSKTKKPIADGLLTQEKGLILGIETADCLPIFLLDSKNKVVSLVHAGWRGTEKKIIQKAIYLFKKNFSSSSEEFSSENFSPKNLWISFGPGIRSCCYEVSSKFSTKFRFVSLREGRYFLDLFRENYEQALELGIPSEQILEQSGLCTSCHLGYFFSFRREQEKAGRMISFIVLA